MKDEKREIISVSQVREISQGKKRSSLRMTKKSSEEERRVDAKAPYAEEGRGKLRKATGSRKQALIRRYPNGETQRESCLVTVE